MNTKHLRKPDYHSVVAERKKQRAERERRATSLRVAMASEYRAIHGLSGDAPIPVADQSLLDSAVSAASEIEKTTAQMVRGFARSELRRSLRALGMIGDSGEDRADPNARPMAAPTDENMREVVERFGGAVKEAVSVAHESD